MIKKLIEIFKYWIPLAIAITLICGLVYLAVQQDMRIGANDPQIQIVEDSVAALSNGSTMQSVVPPYKIDMAKSLAPYIMVFDQNGQLVASSVTLNGQDPTLPSGVFDYAKNHRDSRLTWQPASGVRSAVVVMKYSGAASQGFVLVGRSLREVENRENWLTIQVTAVWLATIFITFTAVAFFEFITSRKRR